MTDLQQVLFDLLCEFDAICRKHDIVYYLSGGTNLGALRHGGFIPWDDDSDIRMSRKEYEKLMQVIELELKDNRVFMNHDRYREYNSPVARYCDLDSTALFASHLADGTPYGIYVDVIIMDPMPIHEPELTEWKKLQYVYCELIEDTRIVAGIVRKKDWEYIDEDLYLEYLKKCNEFGRETVLKELEARLFTIDETDAVDYCLRFGTYGNVISPIAWYGAPREIDFESAKFYVADKAEWCAIANYGLNWKNIPEEKMRQPHTSLIITDLPCGNLEREYFKFIKRNTALKRLKKYKTKRISRYKLYRATYFDRFKPFMHYLSKKMDKQFELYGEDEIKKNIELADDVFGNYLNLQLDNIIFYNEYYVPLKEAYRDIFIEYLYKKNRIYEARQILHIWEHNIELSGFQIKMKEKIEDVFNICMFLDVNDFDNMAPLLDRCNPSEENFILVKAKIMLDLHNAKSKEDYNNIERDILCQLEHFPGEGELLKLYGDILTLKNEKYKARIFYDKAIDVLENGVVLLELAKMGIEKAIKKVYDKDGAYSYKIDGEPTSTKSLIEREKKTMKQDSIMKNKRDDLVIGIVGGMGSYATVDFFKRIIDAFPAEKEWERPRVIVDNNCTRPSRVRAILYDENKEKLISELSFSVNNLLNAGATKIILACNTSHCFLENIFENVAGSKERILNIVEACAEDICRAERKDVFLLATEGTILSQIYEKTFEKYSIKCIAPGEDTFSLLRDFIEAVKQKNITEDIMYAFTDYINGVKNDSVVLGCTELPILYNACIENGFTFTKQIFDPLEAVIGKLISA